MTHIELRKKFIEFWKEKPRNHVEIPSSSLVPENDPTTLFTSAGMQPLIPYLKGNPHPKGKRLVDVQPSLRLQDIDEVGNNRHTTFFEMLGNWSLGDYFKREQLTWCWDFFTKELNLPPEKLWISVFEGTKEVPKDTESFEVWKSLGVPEERIHFYGADKNWWSRGGTPEAMPPGEIGGPDSEVFYDFETAHDKKYGPVCHPNCDCERFLEIGNSVFIQYQKGKNNALIELPQKNVDFGGGLERISAALNGNPDIFQIDIFKDLRNSLLDNSAQNSTAVKGKEIRIFLDHSRAAIFLIAEGLRPGKNERESVLRRLIRGADEQLRILNLEHERFWKESIEHFQKIYSSVYSDKWSFDEIFSVIITELRTYGTVFKNLEKEKGELDFLKRTTPNISGASTAAGPIVFRYRSTFGVPGTASEQIAQEVGLVPDIVMQSYQQEMEKHRELSRTASAGMFKGGLADNSEIVTKYHTATHLLQAALRKVLGDHVHQEGSNLTAERLRFDFSQPQKLTPEETKQVEDLVNKQIEADLPRKMETMTYDEAIKSGSLAFFKERYPDKVTVYSFSNFSKEICGGPHVEHTVILGKFKIIKEEAVAAGTRRIYATLT